MRDDGEDKLVTAGFILYYTTRDPPPMNVLMKIFINSNIVITLTMSTLYVVPHKNSNKGSKAWNLDVRLPRIFIGKNL